MQMLQHHDDAADAVQDSLHRLLRKRHWFDPGRGQLRAWFLKIVRNRCLDMLRSRSRRATEPMLNDPPAASGQRPDQLAEKAEMSVLLKTTLMTMPEDQRELILLRDFHNLSYAEIAEVIAIPKGTVMSRLHRARRELQRRLQDYR